MVDKRKGKSLGELTAYERWELPNIAADGTMESVVAEKLEKVKPLTAEDIEIIRQQAYKDGFEEGRLAGLDSGMQEGKSLGHVEGLELGKQEGHGLGLKQAQSEINALKQQLASLIEQIHSPLEAQSELVHEVLLNVVVALSRSVIHNELEANKDLIKTALVAVIESLPDLDEGVVLSVNQKDYSVVQELLESINHSFDLVADDSLINGGFKIKTCNQLIDYTIEKRFQKAVQSMLSKSLVNNESEQEIPSSIGALSDYSSSTLSEIDESESNYDSPPGSCDETSVHENSISDDQELINPSPDLGDE